MSETPNYEYKTADSIEGQDFQTLKEYRETNTKPDLEKLKVEVATQDEGDAGRLRLRAEVSEKGNDKIITRLSKGTEVKILSNEIYSKKISGINRKFVKVDANGKIGFLPEEYLKVIKEDKKEVKKDKNISEKEKTGEEKSDEYLGINKKEIIEDSIITKPFTPKYEKVDGEYSIVDKDGKYIYKDRNYIDVKTNEDNYNPNYETLVLNSRKVEDDNGKDIILDSNSIVIDEIKDKEGFHLIDSDYVVLKKGFTFTKDGTDEFNINKEDVLKSKIIDKDGINVIFKIKNGKNILLHTEEGKLIGIYFSKITKDEKGSLFFFDGDEKVFEIKGNEDQKDIDYFSEEDYELGRDIIASLEVTQEDFDLILSQLNSKLSDLDNTEDFKSFVNTALGNLDKLLGENISNELKKSPEKKKEFDRVIKEYKIKLEELYNLVLKETDGNEITKKELIGILGAALIGFNTLLSDNSFDSEYKIDGKKMGLMKTEFRRNMDIFHILSGNPKKNNSINIDNNEIKTKAKAKIVKKEVVKENIISDIDLKNNNIKEIETFLKGILILNIPEYYKNIANESKEYLEYEIAILSKIKPMVDLGKYKSILSDISKYSLSDFDDSTKARKNILDKQYINVLKKSKPSFEYVNKVFFEHREINDSEKPFINLLIEKNITIDKNIRLFAGEGSPFKFRLKLEDLNFVLNNFSGIKNTKDLSNIIGGMTDNLINGNYIININKDKNHIKIYKKIELYNLKDKVKILELYKKYGEKFYNFTLLGKKDEVYDFILDIDKYIKDRKFKKDDIKKLKTGARFNIYSLISIFGYNKNEKKGESFDEFILEQLK